MRSDESDEGAELEETPFRRRIRGLSLDRLDGEVPDRQTEEYPGRSLHQVLRHAQASLARTLGVRQTAARALGEDVPSALLRMARGVETPPGHLHLADDRLHRSLHVPPVPTVLRRPSP